MGAPGRPDGVPPVPTLRRRQHAHKQPDVCGALLLLLLLLLLLRVLCLLPLPLTQPRELNAAGGCCRLALLLLRLLLLLPIRQLFRMVQACSVYRRHSCDSRVVKLAAPAVALQVKEAGCIAAACLFRLLLRAVRNSNIGFG